MDNTVVIHGAVWQVRSNGPVHVLIRGSKVYAVTTDPPACTCPDAVYRQRTCKHILAMLAKQAQQDDPTHT